MATFERCADLMNEENFNGLSKKRSLHFVAEEEKESSGGQTSKKQQQIPSKTMKLEEKKETSVG